jgi:hypothetical protein
VTSITHKFSSEPTFVVLMTRYTLTMTPPDGPRTVRRGLDRDQALWALTDLMYGETPGEGAEPLQVDETPERLAA